MARYTLHYNSHCQDCVRLARWNRRLDWLNRFERSTDPSPMGTPDIGDIHVVDHRNATICSGVYATHLVCRNIPAFWPMALLLKIPFVFNTMARQKPAVMVNAVPPNPISP